VLVLRSIAMGDELGSGRRQHGDGDYDERRG